MHRLFATLLCSSSSHPCCADFALILPNPSYVKDLGALLPAVGAVCEAAAAASSGRMSRKMEGRRLGEEGLGGSQHRPAPCCTLHACTRASAIACVLLSAGGAC